MILSERFLFRDLREITQASILILASVLQQYNLKKAIKLFHWHYPLILFPADSLRLILQIINHFFECGDVRQQDFQFQFGD